jgi:hypothetical protein
MTGDAGKTPEAADSAAGQHKITPRDVASATAVGAAARLGVGRRKAGSGVAAGAAAGARPSPNKASLMTAVLVIGIMVGMLAIMIVFSR